MTEEGRTTGAKDKKRKLIYSGDEAKEGERNEPAKRVTRSASSTPVKESSGVHVAKRREEIKEGKRPVGHRGPQPQKTKIQIREPGLPPKLFDRTDIPKVGKVNSYSKTEHLLAITEVLHGTTEYQTLLESPLGRIFELTTKRGALSGKVTHNLLCRMLLTRKRRELWFVFANRPIRYSLKEFGYLTGLNCGPYPPKDQALIDLSKSKNAYWFELIGPKETGVIRDLVLLLKRDKRLPEAERMPMSRRFRLALVVLVDGVLCCRNCATVKATRLTVERVKDIDSFLAYPWGRESFELTLEMVTPGNFQNPTIEHLVQRLTGQDNVAIKGFTAAFQLLLYETCRSIRDVLEEDENVSDFTNPTMVDLPKSRNFSNSKIEKIEDNPKTTVISILDYGYDLVGGDFSWPDEIEDSSVTYLLTRIQEGYQFKEGDFTKGVIDLTPIEDDEETKKSKNTKRGAAADEEEEDVESMSGPEEEPQIDMGIGNSGRKRGKPRGRTKQKPRGKVGQKAQSDDANPIIHSVWKAMKPTIQSLFMKFAMQVLSEHSQGMKDVAGTSKAQPQLQDLVCGLQADVAKKEVQLETKSEATAPTSVKQVLKELEDSGMLEEKRLEQSDEESDSDKLVRRKGAERELSPIVEKDSFDLDDVLTEKLEESNIESEKKVELNKPGPEDELAEVNQKEQILNVDEFDDEVELPDEDEVEPVSKGNVTMEPKNTPVKIDTTALGRSTVDERMTDKVIEAESSRVAVHHPEQKAEDQKKHENEDQMQHEDEDQGSKADETQDDDIEQVDAYQDTTMTGGQGSSKDVGDGADSNPLGVREPSTRARKKTVKFGDDEFGLGPVDKTLLKKFLSALSGYIPMTYKITEVDVPKEFFNELYTKSFHVNTVHMDLMLQSVWNKFAHDFVKHRAVLTDIYFIEHLLTDHKTYNFKDKAANDFQWHQSIEKMAEGTFSKRQGKVKWYDDVDKVYAPMHWEPDHWVGLCIDIVAGRITIFDSNINYVKKAKMMKTMRPLMEILPELVKHIEDKRGGLDVEVPSKFTCERPTTVYQNFRSGDCGPLSIKYMELHMLGRPLQGLTERMVDNLRMHYAIDVYQNFVQRLA